MSAIENTDAPDFDESNAAEAFLKVWGIEDAEKPSEATELKKKEDAEESEETEADSADDAETDEDEAIEGDEAEETDEDEGEVKTAEDDLVVKVKVGDEEKEFTVSSLKRLAGQEAALTRKSQEVAQARKAVEAQAQLHAASLQAMLERAKKRYEPYSKIDFLAAAKDPNISVEELSAARDAAMAAYEDVKFLESELSTLSQTLLKKQHEELVAQAKEAIKVLSDPETGIEGWGEKLYGEIRDFAINQGIDPDIVNKLVDPAAIKIIHKAMLYERGKAKVKSEPGKKKAPKKIIKSTASPAETKATLKASNGDKVLKKLRESGSTEDAAEVFLARWQDND